MQSPLRPNGIALLPPIQLYRRLLRAHRKHLPGEMRLLGDEYIKAEFRAHRTVENPAHLVIFMKVHKCTPGIKTNQLRLDWIFDRVATLCTKSRR